MADESVTPTSEATEPPTVAPIADPNIITDHGSHAASYIPATPAPLTEQPRPHMMQGRVDIAVAKLDNALHKLPRESQLTFDEDKDALQVRKMALISAPGPLQVAYMQWKEAHAHLEEQTLRLDVLQRAVDHFEALLAKAPPHGYERADYRHALMVLHGGSQVDSGALKQCLWDYLSSLKETRVLVGGGLRNTKARVEMLAAKCEAAYVEFQQQLARVEALLS